MGNREANAQKLAEGLKGQNEFVIMKWVTPFMPL